MYRLHSTGLKLLKEASRLREGKINTRYKCIIKYAIIDEYFIV